LKHGVDYAVAAGRLEDEGLRSRGACSRHQMSTQQLMRAVEADFYVGVGDGEDLGGFSGAQLLEIAQD
jgi:hypothetical protein